MIILKSYLKLNTKQNMILRRTQNINFKTKMLQRLPIVFAQVKAGNTSEILLIDVNQIIYSLY